MKKVVIIGAGFGGLALAARLQARGFAVTLLEKNSQVGGHAYQLQQQGYTFDLGPSLITIPDLFRRIFTIANRKLEDYVDLVALDPYYRIFFHDGTTIDYTGDSDRMKAQMRQYNPADADNYERFIGYISQIYDQVIVKGLGSQPFDWPTLFKFAPQALKLKVPIPAYNVVKSYFKDFRNQFTFSFNSLFIGGSPFRASSVYLMIPYLEKIAGVWYAKGGMYSMVQALEKLFTDIGGQLRTAAEVTEIVVKNGRATGVVVHDQFVAADLVISNAHFAHTYQDLIKPEHRRKWSDSKVQKMAYSMSAFLLYLGSRKKYPKLLHHNLIIAKRYRELIRDIFDRKILADDFSIYCHVPTRTDAGMAPPGCENMYFLIPVPNLAGKIDWSQAAEPFKEKVLHFLEHDFGLTDLKANLQVSTTFTPEDFRRHCNDYLGSAWGLEPRLTQTATLRPHNRSEDIRQFYLVGTSTHPGAGIPGVLLTAEATENAILADIDTPARKNAATTVTA